MFEGLGFRVWVWGLVNLFVQKLIKFVSYSIKDRIRGRLLTAC